MAAHENMSVDDVRQQAIALFKQYQEIANNIPLRLSAQADAERKALKERFGTSDLVALRQKAIDILTSIILLRPCQSERFNPGVVFFQRGMQHLILKNFEKCYVDLDRAAGWASQRGDSLMLSDCQRYLAEAKRSMTPIELEHARKTRHAIIMGEQDPL